MRPYHEGELEVQRRAGSELQATAVAESIIPRLPRDADAFLRALPMVLAAGRDRDGGVWCVPLAGPRGFVRALDERTLRIAARTPTDHPLLRALEVPCSIGLLAADLTQRRRVRINGRGGLLDGCLYVRVEHAYVNCRKHLSRRLPPEDEGTRPPAPALGPERTALEPGDGRLMAGADTFFVGSVAAGGADAAHRGGRPGFVTVVDEDHVAWPDYTGNAMFSTLGNLTLDPRCGLAFVDWDGGDALTVTGTATIDWDPERAASVPGADRVVDFTVARATTIHGAVRGGWRLDGHSPVSPTPVEVPSAGPTPVGVASS